MIFNEFFIIFSISVKLLFSNQASGLFFMNFLSYFPIGCYGNQSTRWISIPWLILAEDYPRTISVKLFSNQVCHWFFKIFFLSFTYISLGRGQFWPRGHDLNKLGKGPLGNTTCQISKLWAFWFILRRFLKIFLCKIKWPLGRGQFWIRGHDLNKLGRGPLDDASYQISKL